MVWLVETGNIDFHKLNCIHQFVGRVNISCCKSVCIRWFLECGTTDFCNSVWCYWFLYVVSAAFESRLVMQISKTVYVFFFCFSFLVYLNSFLLDMARTRSAHTIRGESSQQGVREEDLLCMFADEPLKMMLVCTKGRCHC